MKRQALLRKLTQIAAGKGLPFTFVRHGAKHDLYLIGTTRITVPRHPDINEITAAKEIKRAGKV
jgi:hypothetical protein